MNQLELCLGSVQEMTEGSIYAVVDRYAQAARIAYIDMRGKVSSYLETILDEGDIALLQTAERSWTRHDTPRPRNR